MDYKKIREKLDKQNGLGLYDIDELNYVQKPLGRAVYTKKKVGRPKSIKPTHWSDRIKCEVCGDEFTRSAGTLHRKTRHHQDFEKMNNKMRKILIG
ncbi:MAG TPA: hypothetical protein VKR58_01065 [Aquella sp.]|nr:hypothetical protein [Aquella sp.]